MKIKAKDLRVGDRLSCLMRVNGELRPITAVESRIMVFVRGRSWTLNPDQEVEIEDRTITVTVELTEQEAKEVWRVWGSLPDRTDSTAVVGVKRKVADAIRQAQETQQ